MAFIYGRGYRCQIIMRSRTLRAHFRAESRKLWGATDCLDKPAKVSRARQMPMTMGEAMVRGCFRVPELNPGTK